MGAAALGSPVLMGFMVALTVLLVLACVLVQTALSGIYSAALYRYAVCGDASTGFDNSALQNAFLQK